MAWSKVFVVMGAILGALAVMIGAFGAHGLKSFLTENDRLETFETAVKYHMYHALALVLIGILFANHGSKQLAWSGNLMMAGVLFFSGSLYLLCFTSWKWLGPITPIGGLFFIAGWVMIVLSQTLR